ncbi:ly6/PLAUR domain-containing protein 6B-like [Puntigrus tetrazona]|uniref:ly6/PLAUR domain-containing protein 6B-like n=1 Tax=Puntigrus tetrazona TaxID=1606681 RepID=UPI001C89D0AF|nr:ly6/PLAUR domain-containing protein 6B-like [Puntigrus tetrazona]
MDLKISVFLLLALCTAGQSLRCYECLAKSSCANQKVKTCPKGFSKCMSSTAVTQIGTMSAKVKAKDCVVDCVTGSMNLGIIKRSTVCCNTDQCNNRDAPDPSNVPNGKKCYTCEGTNCSKTLSCSGNEDNCFTATASHGEQPLTVKGCVSTSICNAKTIIDDVQKISCCSGNLCNGVQSVSQSVNGVKSVSQSVNGVKSVSQSVSGVQSVSQSFLFLGCSLLSFILLH